MKLEFFFADATFSDLGTVFESVWTTDSIKNYPLTTLSVVTYFSSVNR